MSGVIILSILPLAPDVDEADVEGTGTGAGCITGGSVGYNIKC